MDVISVLQPFSIGISAENKTRDTRFLNVVPIEHLPALDGEITFNPQETTTSYKDIDGKTHEIKTTQDISLTAEWLPMGSNRVTPPDVRRGEYVQIYRLGDTSRYFWRILGISDNLRRLETAIFAFNANPNESNNGVDFNNCYFMEISTHQKTITLVTSKANGEPYQYALQINAGEGRITIEDDIENSIELDSNELMIKMENSDGTFFEINKDRITGKNRTESFFTVEGDNIHIENNTGSYLDFNGDTIKGQNDTGSFVEIDGTDITAENSIGTKAELKSTLLELTTSTGETIKMGGGTIVLEAPGGVMMKSGTSAIGISPSAATFSAPMFEGTTP